jgi:carboxyl-terminal processing protease
MKRLGSMRAAIWLTGLLLALVLAPAITACGSSQSAIGRVISVLTNDETPLPLEAQKQMARFETVYKAYSAQPDDKDRLKYFEFAFRRVRVSYVHEVSDATLIDAAIKGVRETKAQPGTLEPRKLVESALETMVSSLDPHSSYLNADEFRESFVQTSGEFGGLGIEITMEDGLVKVIAPIEDTPAERAGLKSGDLIVSVDGQAIQGKTLVQAVKSMRGRPGTDITLTIRRTGVADFPVTMTRAIVKIRAVRWRVEGNIGYIRVTRFTEKVETGVEDAIVGIRAALGGPPAGIVLDLRNNPGGLLDQSLALADAFLDNGEIVSIRGRTPGQDRSYRADQGDFAKGVPMVVLINGGSASASEIVASALQHHRRATVMGVRSFGKGSVQTILPMPVEGGLRLTTALYFAPDGHTIQARGVAPDIVLTPSKEPANARHEADLPGALPAEAKDDARTDSRPTVPEEACPPASDKEDKALGCALTYLYAGSATSFLATIKARPQI